MSGLDQPNRLRGVLLLWKSGLLVGEGGAARAVAGSASSASSAHRAVGGAALLKKMWVAQSIPDSWLSEVEPPRHSGPSWSAAPLSEEVHHAIRSSLPHIVVEPPPSRLIASSARSYIGSARAGVVRPSPADVRPSTVRRTEPSEVEPRAVRGFADQSMLLQTSCPSRPRRGEPRTRRGSGIRPSHCCTSSSLSRRRPRRIQAYRRHPSLLRAVRSPSWSSWSMSCRPRGGGPSWCSCCRSHRSHQQKRR